VSKFLKGNFKVKREINLDEESDEKKLKAEEYKKKALASLGGSMVFVEREKLFWQEDNKESKE
jgi:hypothetical protein